MVQMWHRLGCRLEYCATSVTGSAPEMVFSVQHPDLSSGLVAPAGASTADFLSASCSVEILPTTWPPTSVERRHKMQKLGQQQTETYGTFSELLCRSLTVADRKAIDDFVQSMGLGVEIRQPAGGAKRRGSTACDTPSNSTEVKDLFQTALRVFVLGHKSQIKGVSVLESCPSQALVDLMPAVFHMPYLKVRITWARARGSGNL